MHVLRSRSALILAAALVCGVAVSITGARAADPVPVPAPVAVPPSDPRPNIVVVLTDDQRRDTLWAMPAVQRLLVERGITFRQAMVPTSLCCPSRATILTGRYAHTTRVFGNGDVGGARYGGWPRFYRTGAERETIAVALDRAGYHTGMFGKYLNYFHRSPRVAGAGYVPPGWDEFSVLMSPHGAYYKYRLSDGEAHGEAPEDYSTDVIAQRAVNFIQRAPADQPLLLFAWPYGPHAPYKPAPRHLDTMSDLPRYTPRTLFQSSQTMPQWMADREQVTQSDVDLVRQRQYEALQSVDDMVLAIDQALERTGRDRNTLFIFSSDNGYFWGEHRIIGKDSPYRDSTRVPMVLRWDGRAPAGARSDRLVLNVDIAATIAKAAGVRFPSDGMDMLGDRQRSGVVLEAMEGYHDRPPYCGWRSKNRMYVRWATGEEELYDYRSDPYEQHNLADRKRYDELRKRMKAKAKTACSPVPPGFRWSKRDWQPRFP